MKSRVNLFCPFCNAEGSSQPVLSPMSCVYILGRKETEERPEAPSPPPAKGKHEVEEPHFEYRCQRCGFTEIHERSYGEAA